MRGIDDCQFDSQEDRFASVYIRKKVSLLIRKRLPLCHLILAPV